MASSSTNTINYLRSLSSVRERCSRVFALAESSQLEYWSLDLDPEPAIVDFVCDIIARDYGTDYFSIPPHSQWCRFDKRRLDALLATWDRENVPPIEVARRMVDLMVLGVVMDAREEDVWYRTEKGGEPIGGSEESVGGSLEMFETGVFSGAAERPHQVDG